jgi:branched-subunit amino acid aminotransferase/4-amino-4-deoxychorismate lyase
MGLKLVRKNIFMDDLPEFQAMFLTGTSLHVLPIRQVDQLNIPVDQQAMRTIMNEFNRVVYHYLGILEI